MSDLSKLFHGAIGGKTFLNALETTPQQLLVFEDAQRKIKNELKEKIEIFSSSNDGGNEKITPRFFLQGSWAYRTINQPCHVPPQQLDYDLGIYLPVRFLDSNEPKMACQFYFQMVDSILEGLAKKQNWTINRTKKPCTRIFIGNQFHIDVPLYAIADTEFVKLAKALETKRITNSKESVSDSITSLDDWSDMDQSSVHLAMRGGKWKISDPKKLHNWFQQEAILHGEQLRRICRYLKAWRDFQWNEGGPSSIFLMVCAVQVYEEIDRDDTSLLTVLKALPQLLENPVYNPTDENEEMTSNLGQELISETSSKISVFASDLSMALASSKITEACDLVIKHLGKRFPRVEESFVHAQKQKSEMVTAALQSRTPTKPWYGI